MLACLLDVSSLLLPASTRHAVQTRLAIACYAEAVAMLLEADNNMMNPLACAALNLVSIALSFAAALLLDDYR